MVVDSETARQFIIFQTRHHKKTNVSLYVMEKHHFFRCDNKQVFPFEDNNNISPSKWDIRLPHNKGRHLYAVKLLMVILHLKNIT